MSEDSGPQPPAATLDWQPVLAFLPWLQGDDPDVGEWVEGELREDGAWSMPYEALSARSQALVQALYDQQVVVRFDWSRWLDSQGGDALAADTTGRLLAQASLEDVRKLLLAHVRSSRFSEGHLLEVLRNGHVRLVLERVALLVGERTPDGSAA